MYLKKTMSLIGISCILSLSLIGAENKKKVVAPLETNFNLDVKNGLYDGVVKKSKKKSTATNPIHSVSQDALNYHNNIKNAIHKSNLKLAMRESSEFLSKFSKNDSLEHALALVDAGEIEKSFGNFEKAWIYHEKAFNLYTSLRGTPNAPRDLSLSSVYILDTMLKNDINDRDIELFQKESSVQISRNFDEASLEVGEMHIIKAKFLYSKNKIEEGDKELDLAEKSFYGYNGYGSLEYQMVNIERGYEYILTGSFDDAIRYIEKGLKGAEPMLKKINPNHYLLAEIYKHEGLAYLGLNEHEKAINKYKKALEIYNVTTGIKTRAAAAIYNNLGLAFSKVEKNTEAIDCFTRGLDINKKVLGIKSHEVAALNSNIASVYYKMGLKAEALKHLKESYIINLTLYGKNNKKTKLILNNINILKKEIEVTANNPVTKIKVNSVSN